MLVRARSLRTQQRAKKSMPNTPSILVNDVPFGAELPISRIPFGERTVLNDSSVSPESLLYGCRPVAIARPTTKDIHGEFDPGSGRTLAACLTHASRTVIHLRVVISGERVSNTWATCP